MKLRLIIVMMFLLPTTIVFGQKKYTYTYREHLTSQASSYTTEVADALLEQGKSKLTFLIVDNKGDAVPFANISIKGTTTDTIIRSDLNGFGTAIVPLGTFSISIVSIHFTPIELDSFAVKANTKTTIKTSLGALNALRVAIIYSKRKLTHDEIAKTIDDLSNDRKDNELIKNKTCYIMWEL